MLLAHPCQCDFLGVVMPWMAFGPFGRYGDRRVKWACGMCVVCTQVVSAEGSPPRAPRASVPVRPPWRRLCRGWRLVSFSGMVIGGWSGHVVVSWYVRRWQVLRALCRVLLAHPCQFDILGDVDAVDGGGLVCGDWGELGWRLGED